MFSFHLPGNGVFLTFLYIGSVSCSLCNLFICDAFAIRFFRINWIDFTIRKINNAETIMINMRIAIMYGVRTENMKKKSKRIKNEKLCKE